MFRVPKVVFGASVPQRVVAVVVVITPVVMVNPVADFKAWSGVGPEGTGRRRFSVPHRHTIVVGVAGP